MPKAIATMGRKSTETMTITAVRRTIQTADMVTAKK
jgi:hypothetical protein